MSGGIGAAFLAHHLEFRPVDATFMGVAGHDHRLPPADAGAAERERMGLLALRAALDAAAPAEAPGERMDRRMAGAAIAQALAELERRPRFANPAWYTGEAAFGIVSLLLPETEGAPGDVLARLRAVPDFLADGRARLAGAAVPRGWATRAGREAEAAAAFLEAGLRRHAPWRPEWDGPAAAASRAFRDFAAPLPALPEADPACGEAHLDVLLREVHGLGLGAREAIHLAEGAYAEATAALDAEARRIDPARPWPEIVADGPVSTDAAADYAALHRRAMAEGAHLVTPAEEYGLAFRPMAPAFREVAGALYFLSYRSPPAGRPGTGSTYWVAEGQKMSAVRSTHAVHHGSIGHHTQNARARAAPGVLARVAGTDSALGLSLLGAGTMVEGWACHAQDLMREMPGFLTPAEALLQAATERRNIASVLVDLRLHLGEWSAAQAAEFYAEAGFPAARAPGEVLRNGILPASRAMYWLGTRHIRGMRARWPGDARGFHDALLAQGHVPVAWAGEAIGVPAAQ